METDQATRRPMGTAPGYWIVHPAAARALAWASQIPDAKDGPSCSLSASLAALLPLLALLCQSSHLLPSVSYIGFSGSLACPTIQIAALPHMDSRDGARLNPTVPAATPTALIDAHGHPWLLHFRALSDCKTGKADMERLHRRVRKCSRPNS